VLLRSPKFAINHGPFCMRSAQNRTGHYSVLCIMLSHCCCVDLRPLVAVSVASSWFITEVTSPVCKLAYIETITSSRWQCSLIFARNERRNLILIWYATARRGTQRVEDSPEHLERRSLHRLIPACMLHYVSSSENQDVAFIYLHTATPPPPDRPNSN
jgi:hypothetical protein